MDGSVSVVFLDIYMCKMKEDAAVPAMTIVYICYVDETYIRREKNIIKKRLYIIRNVLIIFIIIRLISISGKDNVSLMVKSFLARGLR